MESIGQGWDLIILSPMINVMIVLTHYLFNNFGLTVIILTIIIRAAMYPLTLRQLKATKALQALQPRIAELQKKYARDKQRLSEEQVKLYKESGMNPAGCIGPMLIQMPIWLALYQAIFRVLAGTPEDFLNLSRHLYQSWNLVFSQVPLGNKFLWLNLATPDLWYLLPVLVFVTMWAQQKMIMVPVADPRQQSQSQIQLYMIPLLFGFMTMQFPSGLALYWVTSNIIQIIMQYFMTGWGELIPGGAGKKAIIEKKIKEQAAQQQVPKAITGTVVTESRPAKGEGPEHGKSGDTRKDRGGGYPPGSRTARRKPGRNRGNNPKRG